MSVIGRRCGLVNPKISLCDRSCELLLHYRRRRQSGTTPLPPHIGHWCSSSVPLSITPSPLQSGHVLVFMAIQRWHTFHCASKFRLTNPCAGAMVLNWSFNKIAEHCPYGLPSMGWMETNNNASNSKRSFEIFANQEATTVVASTGVAYANRQIRRLARGGLRPGQ